MGRTPGKETRHRWRHPAKLVTLLSLGLALSPGPGPAVPPAAAEPVQLRVTRLAVALRTAPSDDAVAGIVRDLVTLLGAEVAPGGGSSELVGTGSGSSPAGALTSGQKSEGQGDDRPVFYESEIRAVALAYRRGTLVALEDLAALWARAGLTIRPGGGQPQEPTGVAVEAAMRAARKGAEAAPQDERGLAIRLVDELGHRDHYPFDLLHGRPTSGASGVSGTSGKGAGGASAAGGEGPLPADAAEATQENLETAWTDDGREMDPNTALAAANFKNVKSSVEKARDEAAAKGDAQGVAIAEEMLKDEKSLESGYAGLAQGNANAMIDAALKAAEASGQISAAEVKALMAQGQAVAQQRKAIADDPNIPPEVRKLIKASIAQSEAAQSGDFSAINQATAGMARAQTELAEKQAADARGYQQDAGQSVAEVKAADGDAAQILAAEMGEVALGVESAYKDAAEQEAKRHEAYGKQEANLVPPDPEWGKFKKPLVGLPAPQKPTSALVLDPIQMLLVNFDLFGFDGAKPEIGAR